MRTDGPAVAEVYDTREIYSGPYVREAPDLFVGFTVGWRASWDCATGAIDDEIFDDNMKSWSGDHCMNPPDVPGIFFCKREDRRWRTGSTSWTSARRCWTCSASRCRPTATASR